MRVHPVEIATSPVEAVIVRRPGARTVKRCIGRHRTAYEPPPFDGGSFVTYLLAKPAGT